MILLRGPLLVAACLLLTLGRHAAGRFPADLDPSEREGGEVVRADIYGDPLPPGALMRLGTARFRHGSDIEVLLFSPRGNIIASYCYPFIRLWDAHTGKELRRIKVDVNSPIAGLIAFSPDGSKLALGERNAIRILDVETGKERQRLKGEMEAISCIAFSPDGKLLVSAGRTPSFTVWNVETGKYCMLIQVDDAPSSVVWRLSVTAQGRIFACGGESTGIYGFWQPKLMGCWEISTGKQVTQAKGPTERLQIVAFSPNGKICYCGGGSDIQAWRTDSIKLKKVIALKEEEWFSSFALSPSGNRLATSTRDGRIQLWETNELKEVSRFDNNGRAGALAFFQMEECLQQQQPAYSGSGTRTQVRELTHSGTRKAASPVYTSPSKAGLLSPLAVPPSEHGTHGRVNPFIH